MAAVSSLPQTKRKKPVTYGKSSRNHNAWDLAAFDKLDDEDPAPVRAAVDVEAKSTVKKVYSVQKREVKANAPKPTKPRKKRQDAWDVPSSDEEVVEELPVKRRSPSRPIPKRKATKPIEEPEPELAPWEKKKVELPKPSFDNSAPERSHMTVTAEATASGYGAPPKCKSPRQSQETDKSLIRPVLKTEVQSNATSAAAKLLARRRSAGGYVESNSSTPSKVSSSNQKRTVGERSQTPASPRKRARTESHAYAKDSDVPMKDSSPVPMDVDTPAITIEDTSAAVDIYDFPGSDEEPEPAKVMQPRLKPAPKNVDRLRVRGAPRSPARKMVSAPARLSKMLPTDTDDTTDDATRSPSVTVCRSGTPLGDVTPPESTTPDTVVNADKTMTPKQTRLWRQLLSSGDGAAPSPSSLAMQDLTLSHRRTTKVVKATARTPVKSSSDVGQRRTKLVDRLKASAPCSEDESSSESEVEDTVDHMDVVVPLTSDATEVPPQRESHSESQSQSQSQSQGSYTAVAGPKITYAQTRSYLPEDSFEDQLMFGFSEETPQRATASSRRTTTQTITNSQKSSFDFEESDDEAESGRMRSVHELRAGGEHQRFMDSLGGLLEDIAEHGSAARSRRRSALIELATKLADKAFADKFYRQGCVQNLLTECNTVSDDIADYVLAAAFVIMAAGDIPDHDVQALYAGGIFSWLSALLGVTTEPKKLAKDRRNNMAKAAQKTFEEFAQRLSKQDLWGDVCPSTVSPRTLSLKACDLLIGKLRRSGDRQELLAADEVRALIPTDNEMSDSRDDHAFANVSSSISALESLSSTALSLSWSKDVVTQISRLFTSPHLQRDKSQHLLFLTLRLCVNVTNENVRNCKVFSDLAIVQFLMRIVRDGFETLYSVGGKVEEDEGQKITLDILVLSMGLLSNLAEHDSSIGKHAAVEEGSTNHLGSLVDIFQHGQQRLNEAESVEQANTNVAYGYLAVMLANICRNEDGKKAIAGSLPEGKLLPLVGAVEEFVRHHQSVDRQLGGLEGKEAWSAFTEKLRDVERRLRIEAERM